MTALVGVIMGSRSDWETMRHAAETLDELDVAYEVQVVSAHRTPDLLFEYAEGAAERGLEVIIAGAGGAAHLPGMCAAKTALPVLGVPVESKALQGMDSLLSIVQMPAGIPVGTLAIGRAGAVNAALLAAAIVARGGRSSASGSQPGARRAAEAVLADPIRARRPRDHRRHPRRRPARAHAGPRRRARWACAATRSTPRQRPAAAAAAVLRAAFDDPAALDRAGAALRRRDLRVRERAGGALALPGRPGAGAPVAEALASPRTGAREALCSASASPSAAVRARSTSSRASTGRSSSGAAGVLKTAGGGYDGKGQACCARRRRRGARCRSSAAAPRSWRRSWRFDRELSVIARAGARRRRSPSTRWSRTAPRGHPAPVPGAAPARAVLRQAAADATRRVADALDYVGVLAWSSSQAGGAVLANELAPRVHNSGHWTIEGAVDQPVREPPAGGVGLPLGATGRRARRDGQPDRRRARPPAELLALPGAHVHLYGKAARADRKLGHVTLVGPALAGLDELCRLADAADA